MTSNIPRSSTDWLNEVFGTTEAGYDLTFRANSCMAVQTNSSTDLSCQLIGDDVERLINRLKSAILIPIFFLIGSPTNCLSMVVFCRHGLGNRMNLALFCLALIDLLNMSFDFVLYAERVYTQFTTGERTTRMYALILSNNFMGIYGSTYVSKILITIVTCDRCLCILLPIKAKTIFGVKTTAFVILLALAVTYSASFIISAGYRLACVYDVTTHVTSYALTPTVFYHQNRSIMIALDNIFIGFLISMGCPIVVLVATVIITVKLRNTIKWRNSTTSSETSKERAVTKMLLALSVEFLVCNIPHLLYWITPLFIPDFRYHKFYVNTREVLLSLLQVGSDLRSCSNFFVYYTFGTKYRETVRSMICVGRTIVLRSNPSTMTGIKKCKALSCKGTTLCESMSPCT